MASGIPEGNREFLATLALESLTRAMRHEEKRLADEGEPFSDEKRAELARTFARHSPIGFLLSLPEVIIGNAMKFDDEDLLEKCIFDCLSSIFSGNEEGGGGQ